MASLALVIESGCALRRHFAGPSEAWIGRSPMQGVSPSIWESIEFFNQARIDDRTDTLTWGDDIDLDPYVLRDKLLKGQP